jgi:hypothetical protein
MSNGERHAVYRFIVLATMSDDNPRRSPHTVRRAVLTRQITPVAGDTPIMGELQR